MMGARTSYFKFYLMEREREIEREMIRINKGRKEEGGIRNMAMEA